VAICDVSEENMAQTQALCEAASPGVRVSTHLADVSDEAQLEAFRAGVVREHETDCIHLLFNNAGIGAAGSFLRDARDEWEKTFDICWKGVYYGCRVFVPLLVAADEGHLINTSSVNGFWATLGPNTAHTSYSAAKFAVKGFTEALITDLRMNAPHVKVSVVMPGHVGTSIVTSSMRYGANELDPETTALLEEASKAFREHAPTSAAEAATTILDGVRADRWRILVGDDAHRLDEAVRAQPEAVYDDPAIIQLLFAELREATGGALIDAPADTPAGT
jgi:NAD(P)-dependent dehydrogenase (short-subunit alcohol dehydrogenase family)